MVKLTQNSWSSGQLDQEMAGRQDMKHYRNGASVLKNFLPVLRGSIRKRPGTDYFWDLLGYLGQHPKFRIIPFGFKTDLGGVLILADHKARVYLSNGYWRDVAGDPLPYNGNDLNDISYVQCGDIIYLAHRDYQPAEIRHEETYLFKYSVIVFNPIQTKPNIPIDGIAMTRAYFEDFVFDTVTQKRLDMLSAKATSTGDNDYSKWKSAFDSAKGSAQKSGTTIVKYKSSVLLDGSEGPLSDRVTQKNKINDEIEFTSPWTESQVHKITVNVTIPQGTESWELRLYKENGGIYGLIGVHKGTTTGPVSHVFIDNNIAPDASITPIDTTDGTPFSKPGDYPGCVGIYQQRLVWASTHNDPARIWMSMVGDFYEYRPHDKLQVDDAIDFILPITQFANINFIVELGRLFAFAECTELVIGSSSDVQGISYETIVATEHSHLGSTKRLPPIIANNSLLFVSRTGVTVRDYDINLQNSRFGGTDVSVMSSSIFEHDPIVDWTWQQEPNYTIWCVLASGRLASFTYFREHEFSAWAVHELGGGGKALGISRSCALTGSDPSHPDTDEIFIVVERTVDGAYELSLERMRGWAASNQSADRRLVMDSVRFGNQSGRSYVPSANASGFPFESVMQTMQPVIGENVGQAQFDLKLGQHAHLRTVDSVGGEVFARGMEDQPSPIPASEDGDVNLLLAGSNNRDGRVVVRQAEPWPFQLTLLELDYEAEEGT